MWTYILNCKKKYCKNNHKMIRDEWILKKRQKDQVQKLVVFVQSDYMFWIFFWRQSLTM
jgi:hypothetical protein